MTKKSNTNTNETAMTALQLSNDTRLRSLSFAERDCRYLTIRKTEVVLQRYRISPKRSVFSKIDGNLKYFFKTMN